MPTVSPPYPANSLTAAHKATLRKALGRCASLRRANEILSSLTGMSAFFASGDAWESFRTALSPDIADVLQDKAAQEYGDFQTPLSLTRLVCKRLVGLGCRPTL